MVLKNVKYVVDGGNYKKQKQNMKLAAAMVRTLTRTISLKLSKETDKQIEQIRKKIQTSKEFKELHNLMYKQRELIEKLKETHAFPGIGIKIEFEAYFDKFLVTVKDTEKTKSFHIEDQILLLTELEPEELTSKEIIDSVVEKLRNN